MNEPLSITDAITLPPADLSWSFSRSGGPGGQHVNTADTRVRLRFALSTTEALPGPVKRRLRAQRPQWLTLEGDLLITSDRFRSRHRNIEDARERLAEAVREALLPPRPRRKTRPTRASKERRIRAKKRRGEVKRGRGRVSEDGS